MCKRLIFLVNPGLFGGTALALSTGMSASTVYLFVRTPPDGPGSPVGLRRLKAVQELRDELRRMGDVIVTASPIRADLQVEITNVFASDDAALPRDGRRVVVIRLSAGDDRMDFVCADGPGAVSAEQQAAKRIALWLESLDQTPIPYGHRLPDALTVTPSNC
jgi:hypothetical protein